ncbi:hypothetical protein [Brevundimonas sp.]|uniref:hypothetical protein n=1 Tax=Brevundimonas sp. TaxID=1871086 RepID=UPI002D369E28|nr:hypothetical protein [Brevundimonas sp.]HYC75110.1 hypothetical protein [Brevundimonas sp.]
MRGLSLLLALLLCGLANPAVSQRPDTRLRVAVVVVTLDEVRQVQARHGRSTLASLGDRARSRFEFAEPALEAGLFVACEDDRPDRALDYCVRYYLTRAPMPADAPPTIVVAFDDQTPAARDRRRPGAMRIVCYGRGVVPADPAAQDTWLWPDSARLHGVREWDRDRDALAACINAAASEPWTGLRQPDLD